MATAIAGRELPAAHPCPTQPQPPDSKRMEQKERRWHDRQSELRTGSAGAGTESLRALQLAKT